MYTELEVINAALRAIGRDQISTLDLNFLDADGDAAKSVFDQTNKDLQGLGWFFNREDNWSFTPDKDNGRISLSKEVLSFKTAKGTTFRNISRRGGYLYDLDKRTYDFRDVVGQGGDLKLDCIMRLEFEDLPIQAQAVIREKTCLRMVVEYGEDKSKIPDYERLVGNAQISLDREEQRTSRHNRYNAPKVAGALSAFRNRIPNPLGGGHDV